MSQWVTRSWWHSHTQSSHRVSGWQVYTALAAVHRGFMTLIPVNFLLLMLRSNHLVQTVRTTFPVVQTVPFTFPLGISHLHLWRSGDGFSVSVCTAGKKMASLIRKPCIIALQLQLCTARPRTRYSRITHAPALLVGFASRKKGSRSMGEEKKEGKNNNNN